MTQPILSVQELKKYFVVGHTGLLGKRTPVIVRAVDGVSFEIYPGETLGLVGESGSGKSTVAYTIVGMYKPTAGKIRFMDTEIGANDQRPKELKKAIQIVFQDPGSSLNPRQTIKQILEMPLRVHRKGGNRLEMVLHLLEIVGLPPETMYKYPRMLSGGEKQIVGIARALATEPSLVILDEPTSALDVSVQAKTINLLLQLQRQFNLSYLFITHDLSLMRNVANRVAIMYLGKICEVANTADFFQKPLHPYTQMLLSSIPVVSEEEEALRPKKVLSQGEIPSPVNIPTGCSFHTRCPFAMPHCSKVDPPFVDMGGGHLVRCHLYP
ncbi:MAG: ABC transporter ATP-binding protein [Anaerolineales bacterium]|nr:ABC transporter ATP-binding protein [Anaerolineales bacterium]MCS7248610.1 ABC transporter ATP-binding protein [Anaerolineales bacterium]MDW8162423.1 ABC transporter ATP-binding protein [Anaerolineales bacterium]MDW8446344.1 ABC transporter ATP-binding protein [Anaerolineales bacterium]